MIDQQSGSATSSFPQQQQHPPLLRRCSMSEPHLDIVPHFLKEEKSFTPFNRVLSGLFDNKGSTFSVNSIDSVDHFPSKSDHHHHFPAAHHQQQLTKGKSAIGMSNFGAPTSAAALGAGTAESLRKSATSVASLYNNNNSTPQPFTTTGGTTTAMGQHFPTIHEDHGLTMTAGREKMSSNNITISPPHAAGVSPPKSGFMNFFGTGGFLSRPVTHSPEENYRLIMALDR